MNELDKWSADYDAFERSNQSQSQNDKYHPIIRKLAEQLVQHPNLNKRVGEAADFFEIPGAFAGGAVQTGGDMAASLANLGLMPINKAFGTEYNVPHPNIREKFEPGLGNDIAFGAGQIGGGLMLGGGLGTGRGAVQALQRLPRPTGWSGLASDVAKGAGAGYALGENEEGDRTLGALIGAFAQPLSSITNRGITGRVLSDRARELERHGNVFENIFRTAEESNAPFIGTNLRRMGNRAADAFQHLRNRLGRDYRDVLDDFIETPSIRNSHELQSRLGTFVRNVEKDRRFKTNSLPPGLQRAYDEANELRRTLRADVTDSLARNGLIEEAVQYPQVVASYAENAAPYFTESISNVMQGVKNPQKLAKRLREDERFMNELGDRYPELMLNKYLPYALTAAGVVGSGLGLPRISFAKEKKTRNQ